MRDKDLSRILLELEEIVGKEPSPKAHTRRNLVELGFTKNEARAWREQEPDFTRRIFTGLDDRRRGNRTCMQVLLRLWAMLLTVNLRDMAWVVNWRRMKYVEEIL